ncbi:MAG: DUF4112 domain-containing protein [Deltaproteobacteria bacterium]|nr:DUF4112 domain-containing protein [Deltaproteobacteria bacterium]
MASGPRTTFTPFIELLTERDLADTSDIRQLADWLDTRFAIPGTNIRFGFDSVIGLVPGIGDLITTVLGAYIIVRARELGAPPLLIARMIANLLIDSVVGIVPVFGDIFDLAFKSHVRNVRLLMRFLENRDRGAQRPSRGRIAAR